MNSNLCVLCKSMDAEFICLCQFPLTHYLCRNDVENHKLKPTRGHQHRILPLSQPLPQTEVEYDQCIARSQNLETAGGDLEKRLRQSAMWATDLDGICDDGIGRIQAIREQYRGWLIQIHQSIDRAVTSSIASLTNNLANSSFQPECDLTRECWDFMNDKATTFETELGLDEDPNDWLATFRQAVEQISSLNVNKEKGVIEDLRKQLTASSTKITEQTKMLRDNEREYQREREQLRNQQSVTNQRIRQNLEEAKTQLQARLEADMAVTNQHWDEMLRRDHVWWDSLLEKAKNRRAKQLALLLCLCWPAVGLAQMLHYEEQLPAVERSYTTLAKAVGIGCLPIWLCCVGAAINRQMERKRRGVKGSFAMDVSLYCLHVWNSCLLAQEKDTHHRIP